MTRLLKTKTFWVGLVAIAIGLIQGIFDGDWSSAVNKFLIGAGLITGRHAIAKIEVTPAARARKAQRS